MDERAITRFWSKVDTSAGPDGCWPWTAGKFGQTGYGQFWLDGKPALAHRVAYLLKNGAYPTKMTGHSCHDQDPTCPSGNCAHKLCCNPSHLQDQSNGENQRAKRTRCRKALHPWITEGVDYAVYGNGRVWACLHCRRINIEKRTARGGPQYFKDTCRRGHDVSEDSGNVYISPKGARQCKECRLIRGRRTNPMAAEDAGRLGAKARWG